MAGKKKKSVNKKPLLKDEKEISAGDKGVTPAASSELGRSVLTLTCPYCSSTDFVKRGTRLKKSGRTQLYLCRACKRTFTPSWSAKSIAGERWGLDKRR